jgi:hypothetical protein
LKYDSFLPRTFFTKRTTKFVERLNVASFIDPFTFFQKVDQYAPSLSQNTVAITLPAEDTAFGFFFLGDMV